MPSIFLAAGTVLPIPSSNSTPVPAPKEAYVPARLH